MIKLISILAVSAFALSLNSLPLAAAEKVQDQPANPKTRDQADAPNSQVPAPTPADESKRYEEYLGAIERCQDIQDVAKQQKCAEQARRKYNRM